MKSASALLETINMPLVRKVRFYKPLLKSKKTVATMDKSQWHKYNLIQDYIGVSLTNNMHKMHSDASSAAIRWSSARWVSRLSY